MIDDRYNSAIVIEAFNEQEFATILMKVASGKAFNQSGIRYGAKEFYSFDTAVKKYISIYNSILQ